MSAKHIFFFLTFFSIRTIFAQDRSLEHSHSHNDYMQECPLTDALKNKFSSIEVDVFLINNELVVSHFRPIFHKPTLETLYLEPLLKLCTQQNGKVYSNSDLILLIDIKSDASKTYEVLKPLLEKYKEILTQFEKGKVIYGAVTIILSGHKPYHTMQNEELRYAFIDQDLMRNDSSCETLYPLASTKYSNIISWKGNGIFPAKEKELLIRLTEIAHSKGQKVRLWASPENTIVWKELLACGVDLINTDELEKLNIFLNSKLVKDPQ